MSKLITPYADIINDDDIGSGKQVDMSAVMRLAQKERLRPSVQDGKRTLLLVIDMQKDFCDEKGSLTVYPGSKRDISNLCTWMYENMEDISDVMLSMDTHYPLQIFHSSFWVDSSGTNVPPFTLITHSDVTSGKYRSIHGNPTTVLDCLKSLDTSGKGGVFIWPEHCLIGTQGFCLENEFSKMLHFHSVAKVSKPQIIFKGTDTYSEMYGIIEPEYNPRNHVTFEVLNMIADLGGSGKSNYDNIFIAGEAASHCVLESASQILKRFSSTPEVLKKITILEDCTSPVVGFETQAQEGLEKLKKQYGIRIAKSTEIQISNL